VLEAARRLGKEARAWTMATDDLGVWIAAPSADATIKRWWLVPQGDLQLPVAYPLAQSHWQALDIDAGLPWVQSATQDVFIPQTLNLDLIEGVSFTKGCYPGQEVVARSHYR